MKLSQAKEWLPLIQAAIDGKTIEVFDGAFWACCSPDFDYSMKDPMNFRIKPETKLRPWRPEEVPVGAILRTDIGSRYLILGAGNWGVRWANGDAVETSDTYYFLDGFTHSTDGGKTWKICGVEEAQ